MWKWVFVTKGGRKGEWGVQGWLRWWRLWATGQRGSAETLAGNMDGGGKLTVMDLFLRLTERWVFPFH